MSQLEPLIADLALILMCAHPVSASAETRRTYDPNLYGEP